MRVIQTFMREVLPDAPEATLVLAGTLVENTLREVGKRFSEATRSTGEVVAYADGMADMFCAYLASLGPGGTGAAPA